jgi:hypothetical protein
MDVHQMAMGGTLVVATIAFGLTAAAGGAQATLLSASADAAAEAFEVGASRAFILDHNTAPSGQPSAATGAGINEILVRDAQDRGAPDGTIPVFWRVLANSSANAAASLGALHASTSASFELLPKQVEFIGFDQDGNPYDDLTLSPIQPQASGEAAAIWKDSFHIVADDPFAPLTTVTLQFTMQLDANVTGCFGGGYGGSIASNTLSFTRMNDTRLLLTPSADCNTTEPIMVSTTASVGSKGVGSWFDLQDSLYVRSSVPTDACDVPLCGRESIFANAEDTALFWINVLTPGFSVSSDSGHVYSAPLDPPTGDPPTGVPEPRTLTILIPGLVALWLSRRQPRPGEA